MYKYLILLIILISTPQHSTAINEAAGVSLPKLDIKQFQFKEKEGSTTKITQNLTLKVNKDLFEKGVVLKAKTYGKYFANLDVSNLLDLKYRMNAQDKFSSFQKRNSVVSGGLRIGHFVSKQSRLFLRVGFESENYGKGNTLKTPHLTSASQGYWKTALDSGLGFEHSFSNNLSVVGELRTNLSALNTHTSSNDSKKYDSHHGTVLFGVKYLFDK